MFVYADNAATTSVSKTALDAMMPYLTEQYGNPSSLYAFGQQAKEGLEAARKTVAECINAEPREIYFTSGGSEADNQAIVSAAKAGARKGKRHLISTAFEHHAVLHTLKKLEKDGLRTQLLLLILLKPDEQTEILTLGQRYFVKPPAGLGGNWYMTSIFKGWCDEHKLEPDWFKSE
jgi:cysteine desulfurase